MHQPRSRRETAGEGCLRCVSMGCSYKQNTCARDLSRRPELLTCMPGNSKESQTRYVRSDRFGTPATKMGNNARGPTTPNFVRPGSLRRSPDHTDPDRPEHAEIVGGRELWRRSYLRWAAEELVTGLILATALEDGLRREKKYHTRMEHGKRQDDAMHAASWCSCCDAGEASGRRSMEYPQWNS